MITRQQIIDTLEKECAIIRHLYTKIPEGTMDYRPSEGQRSTLELLRYLSMCGSASLHVITNGSDWKLWKPYGERAKEMQAADFPSAMDAQLAEMKNVLNAIPGKDFFEITVKHPTGEEMPLGLGIIRMPFAWLTAYRMQLFLYAKQSGAADLHTSNNWQGKDREIKK